MTSISRTRYVAAPPQAVWEVLAEFGAISRWAANVDHSCLLEHARGGDPAIGTSRRVQVGRDTLVERISEISAPALLGYDIEGLPRRLRQVSNRWTLASAGHGTTVTLTSTVQIGSNPLARVAERAMCRFMARQSDVMLAGLATRVEVL